MSREGIIVNKKYSLKPLTLVLVPHYNHTHKRGHSNEELLRMVECLTTSYWLCGHSKVKVLLFDARSTSRYKNSQLHHDVLLFYDQLDKAIILVKVGIGVEGEICKKAFHHDDNDDEERKPFCQIEYSG
ncbi:hypothetical protein BDA99DRAFT_575671 [Phascolomyces articulosus]|uniref:Uncharacterized protein n=1 Tax=Phascolomyces articulosus TaxID=60185 RepID=A0AAD5JRA8_9FUNG|nr:hypothetical protein BDA99DRAFT_575671 [Phascolomyces articulosus]